MKRKNQEKQEEPNWEEQFEMVEDSQDPEIKIQYDKKYNDPVKNFLKKLSEKLFGSPWRIFNTILVFSTLVLAINTGHLAIWCPVFGIYGIFTNLRNKTEKGELSAYSVMNKNFQKAIGSYKDEYRQYKPSYEGKQPEKHREKTFLDMTPEEMAQKSREYFQKKSKYMNKPCYCGSRGKYKKCCYKADMESFYH